MAILCLLSWARIIPFSVIPTVVGTLVGTLVLLYLKRTPMSFTFIAIQLILHLFPFLILPVKFTRQDVLINLGIFAVFNLWLAAQNETFVSVYKAIVYEDGRLTLGDYLKRRGLSF